MYHKVKIWFPSGRRPQVQGTYKHNGKTCRLIDTIDEGQAITDAVSAQMAEAERRLGVAPE